LASLRFQISVVSFPIISFVAHLAKLRTQFPLGVHPPLESADKSITENCEGTHDYKANIPQTQKICIMWRSFFMAVGIFLILLGLQSLVVDQFLMTSNRRIPKFVTAKDGIFADQSAAPLAKTNGNRSILPSYTNQYPGTFQRPSFQQSAFGPSRFNQGSSGNINQRSNFDLAGFGRSKATSQNEASPNSPPILVSPAALNRPQRVIATQDWMPWSLLAAGTLIVLYTRASSPGNE